MMLVRHIVMRHKIQLIISMRIDVDRIMNALRDMSEHGAAESIDLFEFHLHCKYRKCGKGLKKEKLRKETVTVMEETGFFTIVSLCLLAVDDILAISREQGYKVLMIIGLIR